MLSMPDPVQRASRPRARACRFMLSFFASRCAAQFVRLAEASKHDGAGRGPQPCAQLHQGVELQRTSVAERRASVTSINDNIVKQLDAMSQMNAVNDCFYIWHSGPFATINNFRLGRLPVDTVEWSEINAALGQVALLLSIVEQETDLVLKHQLFPKGSFSQIAAKPAKDARTSPPTYNLYTDGGGFSVFQMRNSSFHKGLEFLLAVVADAGQHMYEENPAFQVPHPIEKDKNRIANISIIFGQGSDEQWTRGFSCGSGRGW